MAFHWTEYNPSFICSCDLCSWPLMLEHSTFKITYQTFPSEVLMSFRASHVRGIYHPLCGANMLASLAVYTLYLYLLASCRQPGCSTIAVYLSYASVRMDQQVTVTNKKLLTIDILYLIKGKSRRVGFIGSLTTWVQQISYLFISTKHSEEELFPGIINLYLPIYMLQRNF